ncbi:MAG: TonB-dependent receptor [Rhodospirillaceae bacterium]|nr:TonB-dependent receptor [Rhodospirillaceae bacterium]
MSTRPFGCSCRRFRSTSITTVTARRAIAFCAGLAACVANSPGYAQTEQETTEQAEDTLVLDTITISANATPTPVNQVGSAVTIITAEELEERGTAILSDVLREVPGLAVSRTGPVGTQTQVRIRGAEANHTVVLIDGIPANDPAIGREVYFADLLAADIERIEVLRGPQSALYGSEAIGGVINIVTRRGHGPIRAYASVEGGSFATGQGVVGVQGGSANYGFAGTATYFYTDGIDVSGDGGENDEYRNLTLSGTGHVNLFDNFRVDLAARYTSAHADYDGFAFAAPDTVVDDETQAQDVDRLYGLLQGTLLLFDDQWEQIGTLTVSDANTDYFGGGLSFSNATVFNARYQSNVYFNTTGTLQTDHIFTVAVERESTHFSNQNGNNDTVDYAFVGQYQLSLLDQIFLTAAVRQDIFDGLEDFTTYRVTGAYRIADWGTRIHGSVGTGVQRPSPTEQFGYFNNFVGNPDLVPEESFGWDIGVEQALFDDRLMADITYFRANLENEITSMANAQGIFSPFNQSGESRRQGVEVAISASPIDNLDLTATYTYLYAEDPDGRLEVRRPNNTASFNANYRFLEDRASISLGVVYNGNQLDIDYTNFLGHRITLDGYTLVNLSGRYEIMDGVEIFGRVENVFDEDYQEVDGYNSLGIGAYGGIRLSM